MKLNNILPGPGSNTKDKNRNNIRLDKCMKTQEHTSSALFLSEQIKHKAKTKHSHNVKASMDNSPTYTKPVIALLKWVGSSCRVLHFQPHKPQALTQPHQLNGKLIPQSHIKISHMFYIYCNGAFSCWSFVLQKRSGQLCTGHNLCCNKKKHFKKCYH